MWDSAMRFQMLNRGPGNIIELMVDRRRNHVVSTVKKHPVRQPLGRSTLTKSSGAKRIAVTNECVWVFIRTISCPHRSRTIGKHFGAERKTMAVAQLSMCSWIHKCSWIATMSITIIHETNATSNVSGYYTKSDKEYRQSQLRSLVSSKMNIRRVIWMMMN